MQQIGYIVIYMLLIVAAIVGMSLKVLPTDVGISMISFVIGHGAGLVTSPVPPKTGGNSVS